MIIDHEYLSYKYFDRLSVGQATKDIYVYFVIIYLSFSHFGFSLNICFITHLVGWFNYDFLFPFIIPSFFDFLFFSQNSFAAYGCCKPC